MIDSTKLLSEARRHSLMLDIINVFLETLEENWDGYDGVPTSDLAFKEAMIFAENLPSGVPAPDVIPEPNGDLGLIWSGNAGMVTLVSFLSNGLVCYIVKRNGEKTVCKSDVHARDLPEWVLDNLMEKPIEDATVCQKCEHYEKI